MNSIFESVDFLKFGKFVKLKNKKRMKQFNSDFPFVVTEFSSKYITVINLNLKDSNHSQISVSCIIRNFYYEFAHCTLFIVFL